jgi:omega-amidase
MELKEKLRITLAQVDIAWENPEQNRSYLDLQIRHLKGKSDLVILPETFTTGFTMRGSDFAESMDGPTIRWMMELSRTTGVAIGGSLLIKSNGFYYNRFVFISPTGEISLYDKRHLFSIGGESRFFTAGDQRVVVNYSGWRIALYVCYDIRFPVWCRNVDDTDLMIITANWPAPRMAVWNILLRARAIENQVYVAGVNRVGTDGNCISYVGESQLINPKGEQVPHSEISKETCLSFKISKKELDIFRAGFPVAKDADRFLII